MKILLDENFPLGLYHRLRLVGRDVEHIIVLGQRGLPDAAIRARLGAEELVFLTNDTEFEDHPRDCPAKVIISRVPQSLPTEQRVDIWVTAIEGFLNQVPMGNLFNLFDDGRVVACRARSHD